MVQPQTKQAESIETLGIPSDLGSDGKKGSLLINTDSHSWPSPRTGVRNWGRFWPMRVVDGKSEVGGFPVVRKPMRQWMLRITALPKID